MLRTVSRMELAHRLTEENEIRTFPDLMDLGPWAEDLGRRMESVLAMAGVALEWTAPRSLLINADGQLLTSMVPEMVNAVIPGGERVKLTVARQGENVHITAAVAGEAAPQVQMPDCLPEEEDQGIAMIRLIAQLHGGALITCGKDDRYSSLAVILPQRLNLPAGKLESPRKELGGGGFDSVQVAFSHLLSDEAFLPEE